jgi:hypothetical protein
MLIEILLIALFVAILFHVILLLYYNKVNNDRFKKKEDIMTINVIKLINRMDNLENKLLSRRK